MVFCTLNVHLQNKNYKIKKFQMKKGNPKNVLRQHLEQGANVPTSATTMRILASWIDVFGTSHHKHPAKKNWRE